MLIHTSFFEFLKKLKYIFSVITSKAFQMDDYPNNTFIDFGSGQIAFDAPSISQEEAPDPGDGVVQILSDISTTTILAEIETTTLSGNETNAFERTMIKVFNVFGK